MGGSSPTSDEILAAIADSGYLMEQRVATQLESLGFHVKTNVAFEDPDEGKSREIDVRAFRRVGYNEVAKLASCVELLVECKNSSNPFVFITRPKNESDAWAFPKQYRFPFTYEMTKDLGGGRGTHRSVEPFFHLGFDRVHYRHRLPAKAVQFCRIDRKGSGWHANHGGLYDAIFYPMAKAVTARLDELPKNSNSDDWKYIWLLFPIVVTTAELFVIDSTKSDPALEQCDHVGFARELKSGKLSGIYSIDFVRQEKLNEFVHDCIAPLADLASDLVQSKSGFLRKTQLEWTDTPGALASK